MPAAPGTIKTDQDETPPPLCSEADNGGMDDLGRVSTAANSKRRVAATARNGLLILCAIAVVGSLFVPPALGISLFASSVVVTFVIGALGVRAGMRRSARSILSARASEQQIARTHQELTAIEQLIADRTIKYADLGERLREASAMLQLSEEQTASIRRAIESAIKRTKRAWWLSLLAFFAGVALNYLVNWTSGAWKPPWIP